LGLDLQGAEQTPDPPERPRKRSGLMDINPDEARRQLEKQKDSGKWHSLVEGNLILKQGLVDKRKVKPQMNALNSIERYYMKLCTMKFKINYVCH
jgi:hypothetical protein